MQASLRKPQIRGAIFSREYVALSLQTYLKDELEDELSRLARLVVPLVIPGVPRLSPAVLSL